MKNISDKNNEYKEILLAPIRECIDYTPKFGQGRKKGITLLEFKTLYGEDLFYKWLGLDTSLMYSAHKTAGGLTSIYRQLGIGCERLIRKIFMNNLYLNDSDVNWSYQIEGNNGKKRTLSLDARIVFESVQDIHVKKRLCEWKDNVTSLLNLSSAVASAMKGAVFEIRQGYKSKDSKRQNADIANASNAYANGYIPCLMVMSAQIDEDIVNRYKSARWLILKGLADDSEYVSTFAFCNKVIGFDLIDFMRVNQKYFHRELNLILASLMRSE